MEKSKKEGYIAGGIFFVVGIIFLITGFDQGWASGKMVISIGGIITLLGIGGIWKPEIVGDILAHYLKNQAQNQDNSQRMNKSNNSNQAIASGNSRVKIENHYYRTNLPEENAVDEKKEIIKEIQNDLTKEKLSNTLIKCIRLANIVHSKKDVEWLEKEAKGFEGEVRIRKEEDEIPDYRIINTEIRIASNSEEGYTTLKYNLALGMAIFKIEEWIESYEKMNQPSEMVLNAPMSETFKKVYKDVFKKDPPQENIPYIIRISELKKILNGLKLRISKFINSID